MSPPCWPSAGQRCVALPPPPLAELHCHQGRPTCELHLPDEQSNLTVCCLQVSLLVKLGPMAFRAQPVFLSSTYKETTSTSWGFHCTSLLLFCLNSLAKSTCEMPLPSQLDERETWSSECVGTGGGHGMTSSLAVDNSVVSQQPATERVGYQLYWACIYAVHM